MLVKVDPEIFSLSTSSITVLDDAELRKVKKYFSASIDSFSCARKNDEVLKSLLWSRDIQM